MQNIKNIRSELKANGMVLGVESSWVSTLFNEAQAAHTHTYTYTHTHSHNTHPYTHINTENIKNGFYLTQNSEKALKALKSSKQ